MKPTLKNPTGRNTQAHIFTDSNGNEWFFSYETCIAYRGTDPRQPSELVRVRIPNSWGPTTGRHFKELGCANFETLDRDEFEFLLAKA